MGFYSNDEFRASDQVEPGKGTPICNLYSDNGYPVMLYRAVEDVVPPKSDDDGRQIRERNLVQGHAVETMTVANEANLEVAMASGWHRTVAAAVALENVDGEVEMAKRGPGRPRREV